MSFDMEYRTLTFFPCNFTNTSRVGYQWYATEGEGYSAHVSGAITSLPDPPVGSHTELSDADFDDDETATLSFAGSNSLYETFPYYDTPAHAVRVYSYGGLGLVSCETSEDVPCTGRLPTAWTDVQRFLFGGFWRANAVCLLCVDGARVNAETGAPLKTRIFHKILGEGTENERLVVSYIQDDAPYRHRQAAFYLATGAVALSYLGVGWGEPNKTVVGLSRGVTPHWQANSYNGLDLRGAASRESRDVV